MPGQLLFVDYSIPETKFAQIVSANTALSRIQESDTLRCTKVRYCSALKGYISTMFSLQSLMLTIQGRPFFSDFQGYLLQIWHMEGGDELGISNAISETLTNDASGYHRAVP